jgi:putative iron-regulated protein
VIKLANERGGEANVAVGWHAIEFLLWGQDTAATGPGARSAASFDPRRDDLATRRGEYLVAATGALLADLRTLRAAWAPRRKNHRAAFEADPRAALRAALSGCVVLTAFELGGERLTVPFETRDQEQEHSCFSDTTLADLAANQDGIRAVCLGVAGGPHGGIAALLGDGQRPLADLLTKRLDATSAALRAIPAPFDQAILGADDTPGRLAIAAAIRAMEEQTEVLLLVGAHFGFELPLKPGN